MEDSIFTKIIRGEIPSYKVYEDDNIIAFLDIQPLVPGHVLVVPKKQVSHFEELDDATYTALFAVVKQIAVQIKRVLRSERACVRIEGFNVPHTHIHVYPCNEAGDFYDDTERFAKDPDGDALETMVQRLKVG